jgi:hypothetical protein
MSKLVERARAKAILAIMSQGLKVPRLIASEVPDTESFFLDTQIQWVKVNFPYDNNVLACIYKGDKGSRLNPHIHDISNQHMVILNKKGKLKVITDTAITLLGYPNAMVINAKTPHAIIFEAYTEVLLMWHPKMGAEEWKATFIPEEYVKK